MSTHSVRPATMALVVATVVAADMVSKSVGERLAPAAFAGAHNPDLAFGVATASPLVLVAGTVLFLAVFVGFVGRWSVQVGLSPIPHAMIVGAMVAHIVDRIRFGAVRDFLGTPWGIIDVADIAVLIGVVMLGVALVLRLRALHRNAATIRFEARTLRAVVVDERYPRAA